MHKSPGLILAIIVAVVLPADAQAQVVGVSGQIEVVMMPPSLQGGVFISQTHIRLLHFDPNLSGLP